MNFKKIIIHGFKSFADPTVINLESGFSAIVGPNGCGKSNISEAVRWVLGEKSATAMRAKIMTDIIFAGSDKRPAMNDCEVSLVFDNLDKSFGWGSGEIVLTRRLKRKASEPTKGEGEYFINGEAVRASENTKLFRDIGVGKNSLAVIGQNSVRTILSSDRKERRKIFEEATGIANQKERRKSNENRLDTEKRFLENLQLTIDNLEEQLGPLKRYAESKVKYDAYYAQLKYNEINYYISKVELSSKEKRDGQFRLDSILQEKLLLEKQVKDIEIDINNKQMQADECEKELDELSESLTHRLVEIEKSTGSTNVLSERIDSNTKNTQSLTKAIEEMQGSLKIKGDTIAALYTTRDSSLRKLDELNEKLEEITHKYFSLQDEIISRERESDISNEELYKSLDTLTDIKSTISKLKTERTSLVSQRAEFQEEQEISRSRLAESKNLLQQLDKKLAAINNEVKELSEKYNEFVSTVNSSRTGQGDLREKIIQAASFKSALENKYEMLMKNKKSYDNFGIPVKKLLQDASRDSSLKDCIEGVVAELITVQEKSWEIAIEVALGGQLQSIVTRTQDHAKRAIAYLKERRYGRVTFLPIDNYQSQELHYNQKGILNEAGVIGVASEMVDCDGQYRSVIEGLLGRTVIVETADDAIRINKRYNRPFKMVTLEGELFQVSGSITGGSMKTNSSDLLAGDRALEECRNQIAQATKQYELFSNKQSQLNALLESSMIKKDSCYEKIQDLEIEKASINEKRDIITKGHDDAVVNIEMRESRIQGFTNSIADIDSKLVYIEQRAEDTEGVKTSVNKQKEESKSYMVEKKAKRDKVADEKNKLEIQIAELKTNCNTYAEEIERVKTEGHALERDIKEKTASKEIIEAQAVIMNEQREKMLRDNADNKEIKLLKEKQNELQVVRTKLKVSRADLVMKKDDINEKILKVSQDYFRQESKMEKIDMDLDNLASGIFEEYELERDAIFDMKDEEFEVRGAEKTIRTLKRNIKDLGGINDNAIEDYERVKSEYDDYIENKNDLDKSITNLEQIISKITKEMTIKFLESFDKIRANFKNIFIDLFNGGYGNIRLDDSAKDDPDAKFDPLEAEIVIEATPPGAKTERLSLLSGGQQALVAIGILFSILRTKPMPFCILDELDAPLDDSNGKLYATYLRKFSQVTQFVVITHRHPTMNLAHVLYGVTMQEKGVTKLISVQLKEAMKFTDVPKKA